MLTRRQWLISLAGSWLLMSGVVQADTLPADFQAKADKGIQVLKLLAGDAAIVAAAKAGTPAAGMTNAKWSDLTDQDATVKAMATAAVSAKLTPPAGMGMPGEGDVAHARIVPRRSGARCSFFAAQQGAACVGTGPLLA